MKADFDLILDRCVERLHAGLSVDDCLLAYPEHKEALKPLLETALQASQLPVFDARPGPFQVGRQRLLDTIATQQVVEDEKPTNSFDHLSRYAEQVNEPLQNVFVGNGAKNKKLVLSIVMSFVVFVFLLVVSDASVVTLPGDPLYPMKRVQEDVRLILALDDVERQQLQEQFLQERHREVRALINLRRCEVVEFAAEVDRVNPQHWLVGGLHVFVDKDTFFEGSVTSGTLVKVEIQVMPDGRLIALSIREIPSELWWMPHRTPSPVYTYPRTLTPTVVARTPTPTAVARTLTPTVVTQTSLPIVITRTATPVVLTQTPTLVIITWTAPPVITWTQSPEPVITSTDTPPPYIEPTITKSTTLYVEPVTVTPSPATPYIVPTSTLTTPYVESTTVVPPPYPTRTPSSP